MGQKMASCDSSVYVHIIYSHIVTCNHYIHIFVLIDALSVYLTDPSNPPPNGDSVDLSTMINLYLENGINKPDWIQVLTYFTLSHTDILLHTYACCHYT